MSFSFGKPYPLRITFMCVLLYILTTYDHVAHSNSNAFLMFLGQLTSRYFYCFEINSMLINLRYCTKHAQFSFGVQFYFKEQEQKHFTDKYLVSDILHRHMVSGIRSGQNTCFPKRQRRKNLHLNMVE